VCLRSFADDLRGGPLLTDARIYIPEMYTEPSRFATVVALGPERRTIGEWWKVNSAPFRWPVVPENTIQNAHGDWWEYFPPQRIPFTVDVGDTVLCNRYPKSARPIIWQGQEFVIVDKDEILARVEA
jgi:co-chaperonin GroES (HSP10)